MANIIPSQQSSNSTLNPNGIKTFNQQTTGTGLFDTTSGNVTVEGFNELSLLSNSYSNPKNKIASYSNRTLSGLLSRIMSVIGFFII